MAEPAERTNGSRPRRHGWRSRALVAAAVLVLASTGCSSYRSFKERHNLARLFNSSYDDPQAPAKLAQAQQLFADQHYEAAQKICKELADNQSNPAELAENARFLQAECRRMKSEYPQAVDTYHRLLLDFPTGAHRREACARMFEISDYWLDDFRDELDRRKNEKGVLHWQPRWPNVTDASKPDTDQEGRALQALEYVHSHDVTGPAADKALFWCGYVNFIRGNFQEADHFFSQLVELHKDSPLRPQAISYAIQAKNNATGGAVYDGRKCAEALQLVHMAEASVPEATQSPEMAEKMAKARFAIRSQQAEKDFRMAEYYERTGHPGSAVFYYELVRRRYAGTRYSDLATERKEKLLKDLAEGRKPINRNDPWAVIQAKWAEVFGPKAEPNPDAQPTRTRQGPQPPAGPPAGPNGMPGAFTF
jgi:outer membrane protein assembly factor BamD (BamD/ComL family)